MEQITITDIKQIIADSVTHYNRCLEDTKSVICTKIGCETLNNIDSAYIERKYIKVCCKSWISESEEILCKYIEEQEIFQNVFEFIDSKENDLKFVPKIFQDSKFYRILNGTRKIKCNETYICRCVIELKIKCLEYIKQYYGNIEYEIKFVDLLSEYLFEHNLDSNLLNSLKVELFLKSEITFSDFISNLLKFLKSAKMKSPDANSDTVIEILSIPNVENASENFDAENLDLLGITEKLSQMKTYLLESRIREHIKQCLGEVRIIRVTIDGRNVMQIFGQCVTLSNVIEEIESRLTKQTNVHIVDKDKKEKKLIRSKFKFKSIAKLVNAAYAIKRFNEDKEINEVRFICARSLTIDADLKNDKWHGKNIVVLTKKIIIEAQFTWDVSGLPGANEFNTSAKSGTNVNEIGEKGCDGYSGESGGNILLEAESISNENMLTLISNGGNGTSGQNGGNGYSGKNGVGISLNDFQNDFPHGSTTKVLVFSVNEYMRLKRRKEIVRKIQEISEKSTIGDTSYGTYIEGKTKIGQEIIYSRYTSTWGLPYQEYLVFKGSPGECASGGGVGGRGGEGGYEGEIEVSPEITEKIIIQNQAGKPGDDGKGGEDGIPGRDGHDIAFTDYEYHASVTYYGEREDSKLDLSYHKEKQSNRAYCHKKDLYLEIRPRKSQIQTSVSHAHSEKKQNRQQHSTATRQKSISKLNLLSQYATNLKSSSNFSFDKKVSNKMLEQMTKNVERSSELSVASTGERVMRQVKYNGKMKDKKTKYSTKILEINTDKCKLTGPKETFDDILKSSEIPDSKNNYLQRIELFFTYLKKHKYDFKEIKVNYNTCKKLRSSLKTNEEKTALNKVENLLLKKMKLNVFSEIEIKYIQKCAESMKTNKFLIDEYNVVHLEPVEKIFYQDFNNASLGNLTNFFQSENEMFLEYAIQYFKSLRDETGELYMLYVECLIQFILHLEIYDEDDKFISYRKSFSEFLNNKNKKMDSTWKTLEKKVEKLNRDWKTQYETELEKNPDVDAEKNKFNEIQLDRSNLNMQLLKDNLSGFDLEDVIENYEKELKSKFNWNEYINDDETLSRFEDQVMTHGINFDIFVVFLCEVYNKSIKIYNVKENTDDEYVLFKTYKSQAIHCMHILQTENKFQLMKSCTDIVTFKSNQIHRNYILGNILLDVAALESLESCENYKSYSNYTQFADLQKHYLSRYLKYSLSENSCIENILKFVSDKNKLLFESRLSKFRSETIGDNMLLYFWLLRFECEGIIISESGLLLIMNAIFSSATCSFNTLELFTWIFASYAQEEWLSEIIGFKVEQNFLCDEKTVKTLKISLKDISNERVLLCLFQKLFEKSTNLISLQDILDTAELMSYTYNCFDADDFLSIDFSEWKYNLWGKYWEMKIKSLFSVANEDLEIAVYYLGVIQNCYGSQNINEIFTILNSNSISYNFECFISILRSIFNGDCDVTFVTEKLKAEISLSAVYSQISGESNSYRSEKDIMQIMSTNSNNSEGIRIQCDDISKYLCEVQEKTNILKFNVTEVSIDDIDTNIIRNTIDYMHKTPISEYNNVDQLKIIIRIIKLYFEQEILDGKYDRELLALIDQAIFITRGFRLRHTQRIAIATLLKNENNTLAQVNTGEGKSLIVVALSLMKALRNEKVDIITCSRLLAIRDAESQAPKGYKDIYNIFGINVSHNCSENLDERINAYSGNSVIYGDIGSFQRDYLLDRFYGKNIIGDRNFENVIVDEVDSMLLDKGNNMLYLSQDVPMFDSLEPVLLCIWQSVNSGNNTSNSTESLKRKVISEIFQTIEINDLLVLDKNLNDTDLQNIWSQLQQYKIINGIGEIIVNANLEEAIKAALSLKYPHLIARTAYLIQNKFSCEIGLKIPNYLKPFVLLHVETWVENAISALLMTEGTDYVVDVDRNSSCPDSNPIVTIIDNDTGTDLSNSQWENGLHQFLQMKHGCRLSQISLKAVFISNVKYFQLYNKMHGLSGTLGSEVERGFLKDIHNVDFISIPTARCKQYEEYTPIVNSTYEDWNHNVFEYCMEIVKDKSRSVLIICENIINAENMYSNFKNKLDEKTVTNYLHLYKRDYEEFHFAQGNVSLNTGHIIIATNLAGRGTDIKLSKELLKNGGLHVCVTYLPSNVRVEQQAFGRASRSGEPGSGQLIILNDEHEASIVKLKFKREKNEVKNIMQIKSNYHNVIEKEEHFFEKIKDWYVKIKDKINLNCEIIYKSKIYKRICKLILAEFLNIWALWLDKTNKSADANANAKILTNNLDKQLQFLENLFAEILNVDSSTWYHNFNEKNLRKFINLNFIPVNPTLLIKIAKELKILNIKNVDKNIYDFVIEIEPKFCETAHYNAAYATLKDINWKTFDKNSTNVNSIDAKKYSEAIYHLHTAYMLFENRQQFCLKFAAAAGEIEQRVHLYKTQIIKIDALKKQKSKECASYDLFLESIRRLLGRPISSVDLQFDKINEKLANEIHELLLSKHVIDNFKLRKDCLEKYEKKFKRICTMQNIDYKKVMDLLVKLENGSSYNNICQSLAKVIPNSNEFWNLLTESISETIPEYNLIAVNLNDLKIIDPSLEKTIQNMIIKNEFTSVDIDDSKSCFIYLSDIPNVENSDIKFFLKSDFCSRIGVKRFEAVVRNYPNIFNKIERFQLFSETDFSTSQLYENLALKIFGKSDFFFSKYDYISEKDLTESGIDEYSAKSILKEMINANILIQDENHIGIYRLGINSYSLIDAIQSIDSLYASNVFHVLKYNFSYRIALEDLELQFRDTEKKGKYKIKLPSQPQICFVQNLLGNDFVEPCRVVAQKIESVKEILLLEYPSKLTWIEIIQLFNNNGIDTSEVSFKSLFLDMVEKEWIKSKINLTDVKTFFSYQEDQYNTVEFEITGNFNKHLSVMANEQETMKLILEQYSLASNIEIQKTIKNKLSNFIPLTNVIADPKWKLDDIKELQSERYNGDDIYKFVLNELCHIISIEEARWSWSTILSASAVIGLSAIELGTAMYTAVICPSVSKVCMSEGISDLMYGIQSLWSGKFNWNDYAQHKMYSVLTSVALTGAGNLFSGSAGINLPSKALDPNLANEAGKKICQMTGSELTKFVGMKKIGMEAFKMIGKQVGLKVKDFTLGNAVEYLSSKYLQPFCDWICSQILKFIDFIKFNELKLVANLNVFGTIYGFEKSMDIFHRYITETFHGQSLVDSLTKYCSSILGYVRTSISGVSGNFKYAGVISKIQKFIDVFFSMKKVLLETINLATLSDKITRYIDKINDRIESDIMSHEKTPISKDISEEQMKNFSDNAMKSLKKTLLNEITNYIQIKIVKPFLTYVLELLTRVATKYMKNKYIEYKDNKVRVEFQTLKQNYNERKDRTELTEEERDAIKDEYDKNMVNLMKKTRNPQIFADIIRENVPMDKTCVNVALHIVANMPELEGKNIKFVVKSDQMQQEFSDNVDNTDAIVIELDVFNNHFLEGDDSTDNNCLFAAIKSKLEVNGIDIPISPEDFRGKVADYIVTDEEIQHTIEYGWHELAISKGAIGGRSFKYEDVQLTDLEKEERLKSILNETESGSKLKHKRCKKPDGTKYIEIVETTPDGKRFTYTHDIAINAVKSFEEEKKQFESKDNVGINSGETAIYLFSTKESKNINEGFENVRNYVGKTIDVDRRLNEHKNAVKNSLTEKKDNYLPGKYAKEKSITDFEQLFDFEIITTVKNKNNVRNIEVIYQNSKNALAFVNGFSHR